MCGINGYIYCGGQETPELYNPRTLRNVFEATSARGRDATGFFTPEHGISKIGKRAAEALASELKKPLKTALQSKVFVGHTRASTTGRYKNPSPPTENENNHPFEGERFILVHNGVIDSPAIKNYEYKGHCDSEILLSYLETFGIEDGISYISDTDKFAIVFWDKKEKVLYLYRHTNPLVMAADQEKQTLLFGSTADIVWEFVSDVTFYGMEFANILAPRFLGEHKLSKFVPGKGLVSTKQVLPRRGLIGTLPLEVQNKLEYYGTSSVVISGKRNDAPINKRHDDIEDYRHNYRNTGPKRSPEQLVYMADFEVLEGQFVPVSTNIQAYSSLN